jgi:lipopolysaccharide export system protein LptC
LWLPLAILLLLAALSYWIERSVQISDNGNGAERKDPEGIMENFDALSTDTAGRPHYRLTARKLKHYSDSKRADWSRPASFSLMTRPRSQRGGATGERVPGRPRGGPAR